MALLAGDPLPTFTVSGLNNPRYALDTAAGRYLLLAFAPAGRAEAAMALMAAGRAAFDDVHACGFVVIVGPDPDRASRRDQTPGLRFLFDTDGAAAAAMEAVEAERWVLVDPALHILAFAGPDRAAWMVERMAALPAPEAHGGFEAAAPVLVTPRIFEPPFCAALIAAYRREGGAASGVTSQIGGKTRLVMNDAFKKRSDVVVTDEVLTAAIFDRLSRRLFPQIEKVFNFRASRLERYLVACYSAETGGYFRAHRDNRTVATQHRRFAVSINLSDDHEGGDLRFPEFGTRTYRPPPGGACVFSCSILHEATPVTRGERFAFLPFVHDEAAEAIRIANRGALAI